MPDCSKRLTDLTPSEAYQCFIDAETWQIIGNHLRRMWADFTSTTIGEWVEILGASAVLPAMIASYILPVVFVWRLLRRYIAKHVPPLDGKARRRKNFWGQYLLLAGVVFLLLADRDPLVLAQGLWLVFCGTAILFLGASWWAMGRRH
jgi:glucan phosphoethanolaminetransferase (alkaline phosphatase superfamily)